MRKTERFLLYKVYYFMDCGKDELVYIGKTSQPLHGRLQGHFFQAPMMQPLEIERVSRIECAAFQSAADMYVMEIALINKLKPRLNATGKTKDVLTIDIPHVPFSPFQCPNLTQWRTELAARNKSRQAAENKKMALQREHKEKRREIFSRKDLNSDEKTAVWTKWLVHYYEPTIEAIKVKEDIELCLE